MRVWNFAEWIQKAGENCIFRMWVYKRIFTPYEQEQKFSDESVFENMTAFSVKIREVFELPDKRVMLGVTVVDDEIAREEDDDPSPSAREFIEYYMLDEIRLARYRDPTTSDLICEHRWKNIGCSKSHVYYRCTECGEEKSSLLGSPIDGDEDAEMLLMSRGVLDFNGNVEGIFKNIITKKE